MRQSPSGGAAEPQPPVRRPLGRTHPPREARSPRNTETAFWVALDWATYRTLTDQAKLTASQYEAWLNRSYRATFLG